MNEAFAAWNRGFLPEYIPWNLDKTRQDVYLFLAHIVLRVISSRTELRVERIVPEEDHTCER